MQCVQRTSSPYCTIDDIWFVWSICERWKWLFTSHKLNLAIIEFIGFIRLNWLEVAYVRGLVPLMAAEQSTSTAATIVISGGKEAHCMHMHPASIEFLL